MGQTSRSNTTTQRSSSQLRRKRIRRRQKARRMILTVLALAITAIISAVILCKFDSSHFSRVTTINGIDCSRLTVEDAYTKLNESLEEKVISFVFVENSYTFSGSSFDLKANSVDEINEFLINQKTVDKQNVFTLSSLSLNPRKLGETLKTLPNFDEENIVYPEDAYITLSDDGSLAIVPEVIGNYIDFDTAYDLAYNGLESGYTTIDFCPITVSKPQISSEDLQPIVDSINGILNTSITFNINDETSLTLDKSIMKDWITVDESGSYNIDIDSNLPAFVELLAEKSAGTTIYFEFEATNFGTVTVPAKKLSIDKEAEIELIKSELGTAQSYTHTPAYNIEVGNSYVEVDIARQHVWFYKDGVCIVDTDCVTGTRGNHDTREGYFFLANKETDRILRGYNDNGTKYASHVDFWMPFDGGIGLHDASWRNTFGGNIYLTSGSHGCVNLPRSAAETIYNNIDYSMPIIVYYSTK